MSYPPAPPAPSNPYASGFAAPRGASDPADISLPLYGAKFGQAVSRYFRQYVNFTGRASRSEYWWVALFRFFLFLIPTILLSVGVGIGAAWAVANPTETLIGYDQGTGEEVYAQTGAGILNYAPAAALILIGGILFIVIGLGLILPDLALIWRRLHDINLPGAFALLKLVPSVGELIVFIFALMPSRPEGQRFDV
ncbi:DUF805 domain-containing protein [Mycetocola spongiae]|uniref:DUF805 domain-containing protein n=1 Tax=Mycetocola spongiae TaxID=2859226 RepID=UPI001CF3B851|nr:DUF805 domain-containing protein [Mycetocola spongiae]UCR89447.1 DUF805 domain-containing protein [Mycetocola spongiae]